MFNYPIASTRVPDNECGEMSKQPDVDHSEDAVNEMMNMIDFDGPCVNLVDEQQPEIPTEGEIQLSQFWYSQTLHKVCEETENQAIANKKAKMDKPDQTTGETVTEKPVIHNVVPISAVKGNREQKGKEICNESPIRKGRKSCVLDRTTTNTCTGRGPRRTIKLGDHLRSPYYRRAVDMKVTAEEKRYHEWAQAAVGVITDVVFSMSNGTKLTRMQLASLARQTLDDELSNPFIELTKKYDIFRRNLATTSCYDMEVMQFKNKDFIFFPIVDDTDYYLVVFSLKSGSTVIIDHRSWTDSGIDDIMEIYEPFVETLYDVMAKHLESVNHPPSVSLGGKKHEVLDMHWRNMEMSDEGGVFVMRHMETWMGDERSWKTGFGRDGHALKTQLLDLRKKYSAKIATSMLNATKDDTTKDYNGFHSMDPKRKADILKATSI
ncbi:hypothetical protein OSB04_024193 [Centaurea solstitialis]|uniref:Ubiquitin-like protease family profile domain-containing protein n=1 Tax=Centaurea solstitialis TaxID=347529 RepID=A0AA38SZ03_9ASTR|nr:hypothetical protein OSB04_024193 [Centaurea solstitialis]